MLPLGERNSAAHSMKLSEGEEMGKISKLSFWNASKQWITAKALISNPWSEILEQGDSVENSPKPNSIQ